MATNGKLLHDHPTWKSQQAQRALDELVTAALDFEDTFHPPASATREHIAERYVDARDRVLTLARKAAKAFRAAALETCGQLNAGRPV